MSYYSLTSQRLREWRRKLTLYSDPYDDYDDEYDRSESNDDQSCDDADEGHAWASSANEQQQQQQPKSHTKATIPTSTQSKSRDQDDGNDDPSPPQATRGRGRGRGRGRRGRGGGRATGDSHDSQAQGEEPSAPVSVPEQSGGHVPLEPPPSSLPNQPGAPPRAKPGATRGRANVRGRGRRGAGKEVGIGRHTTQGTPKIEEEITTPLPPLSTAADNATNATEAAEAIKQDGEQSGEAVMSPLVHMSVGTASTSTIQDATPSWKESRHSTPFTNPIPPKKRGRPSSILHSHGHPESSHEGAGKGSVSTVDNGPAAVPSSPSKRGRPSRAYVSEGQKRTNSDLTEENGREGNAEAVETSAMEEVVAEGQKSLPPRVEEAESNPSSPRKRARTGNSNSGNSNSNNINSSSGNVISNNDNSDSSNVISNSSKSDDNSVNSNNGNSSINDGDINNTNDNQVQTTITTDATLSATTPAITETISTTTTTAATISAPGSAATPVTPTNNNNDNNDHNNNNNIPSSATQPLKRVYINEKTKEPRAERLNRQILHMPAKLDKRRSCHLCSFVGKKDEKGEKKQILTQWRCKGCDAHLCLTGERNCFALFHEMKDLAPLREYSG